MANPSAPRNVKISPSEGQIGTYFTISWDAPSDTGSSGTWDNYIIFRKYDNWDYSGQGYYEDGAYGSMLTTTTSLSIQQQISKFDANYVRSTATYTVFCGKQEGSGSSITVTPVSGGCSATYTLRAAAPANFTAKPGVAKPGEMLTFTWDAAAGGNFSSYRVCGTISPTGVSTEPVFVDSDKLTCTAPFPDNVPVGGYVTYTVSAYEDGGVGAYSNNAVVRQNIPPSPPAFISVGEAVRGEPISIAWGAATDPEGDTLRYYLSRSVDGGAFYNVFAEDALSFTDMDDNSGWTTVQYRVCAVDFYAKPSDYTVSERKKVRGNRFVLPDGGRLELLENRDAQPVYPVTVLEGVFRREDGRSLSSILESGGAVPGPAGEGVPAGGAAGQVLAKRTAADYDTQWMDPPEGGGGSTAGVESFNGRTGAVKPQSGDYTAADVGAATMEQVTTAIQNALGSIEAALSEV